MKVCNCSLANTKHCDYCSNSPKIDINHYESYVPFTYSWSTSRRINKKILEKLKEERNNKKIKYKVTIPF